MMMRGVELDDPHRIKTHKQLVDRVKEVGFLPLFSNFLPQPESIAVPLIANALFIIKSRLFIFFRLFLFRYLIISYIFLMLRFLYD